MATYDVDHVPSVLSSDPGQDGHGLNETNMAYGSDKVETHFGAGLNSLVIPAVPSGITTIDQVVTVLANNEKGQSLEFSKLPAGTVAANRVHTLWTGTGLPAAGLNPSAGLSNAVQTLSTTTGAIGFTNPSSLSLMQLAAMEAIGHSLRGYLLLVDRLAHANIAHNQATGNFDPVIFGQSRLVSGEGAQIMIEVTTQLGGTTNVRNFTYINQNGLTGRVTPDFTLEASADVGQSGLTTGWFLPLQGDDQGVRQITATELVSGSAAGAFNVVLVRPLALIPLSVPENMLSRDYIVEIPQLPLIRNSSCLSLYYLPVQASTSGVAGRIHLLER